MNKIFYNPDTGEVKGYSDGNITMELPFIESDVTPVLAWNFKVVDGELMTIRDVFTPEEWATILRDGKL